jgi:hypothetical protein
MNGTSAAAAPPDPKIIDILRSKKPDDDNNNNNNKPFVSLEYFPPRSEEGVTVRALVRAIYMSWPVCLFVVRFSSSLVSIDSFFFTHNINSLA